MERSLAIQRNGVDDGLAGKQRGHDILFTPRRCHVERCLAMLIFVAVGIRAGQQEGLDWVLLETILFFFSDSNVEALSMSCGPQLLVLREYSFSLSLRYSSLFQL